MGQTVPYTGAPLTEGEQVALKIMEEAGVERNAASLQTWWATLSDVQKNTYRAHVKSLRDKNLFQ